MCEKVLVWLLRVSGVILLLALVAVVMPFSWMEEIHRWLGMGELPAGPIVGYLARSLSLFYALHGALLIFVSLDIRRYLPVVKFLAVASILFGFGMIIVDSAAGMPLYWILCEGPLVIPLGIVLLWLAGKITETQ
jgi:hypothetical protein